MRPFLRPLVAGVALLGSASGTARAQQELVHPRVIGGPVLNYPLAAKRAAMRQGEARALVSISEEGELLDFMVIGCTHLAFAEVIAQALPKYRFVPAKLRGEPTPVRMSLTFFFKQEGAIVSLSEVDLMELSLSRLRQDHAQFISWICPNSRLDRPLTPTRTVSPRHPAELQNRRETGMVTVDFFVDGEGRVRMPAVDTGAHPSFAREAVGALSTWEFEPPTSNGQPVIARAVQTFNFSLPPGEAEEPAPARKAAATPR
jgi:periplasmic protein TonB